METWAPVYGSAEVEATLTCSHVPVPRCRRSRTPSRAFRLSRNDSVEKGIATVSVAAIGVPPMALACERAEPFGARSLRQSWSARRQPARAGRPRSLNRIELFPLSGGLFDGAH